MDEVKCPECGVWNPETDVHCSACAAFLQERKAKKKLREKAQVEASSSLPLLLKYQKNEFFLLKMLKFIWNGAYLTFMAIVGFLMWLIGTVVG